MTVGTLRCHLILNTLLYNCYFIPEIEQEHFLNAEDFQTILLH